jgi:hypothetical protein
LIGGDRKWLAEGQNDAIDPKPTSGPGARRKSAVSDMPLP